MLLFILHPWGASITIQWWKGWWKPRLDRPLHCLGRIHLTSLQLPASSADARYHFLVGGKNGRKSGDDSSRARGVSEAARINHPLEAQLCRWSPYDSTLWDSKFLDGCNGERCSSPLFGHGCCIPDPLQQFFFRWMKFQNICFCLIQIAPSILPLSRLMQATRAIWMCHDNSNKNCWFGKGKFTIWNSAEGASEKSCSKMIVH